ncbi:hypothetical protein V5O48_009829 [Marasmius crinis-equi]|uniref:Arsenite methyltransferase n=1 Tax=Marasmius crinis-equi TaxID=585013 RepID=A0ABR3FA76_9AGAR
MVSSTKSSTSIYDEVEKHYGATARTTDDSNYGQRVARAFGYSEDDLAGMPEDANLGLSCGNPLALANLREGETVCDLGSGAGFDVFQAAKKVGKSGQAIGVDFNKDMLQRANDIKAKIKADNVSFVESRITSIPLPDSIIDCMISNCVVNLVPEEEKQLVFNEMFRLLKPGGRVAVSDILAKTEMPSHIRDNMALYVGCIAGASQVADYDKYLRTAGFTDILLVDSKSNLNVYWEAEGGEAGQCCGKPVASACCGPQATQPDIKTNGGCGSASDKAKQDAKDIDFNEFAGSFKIYAIKP